MDFAVRGASRRRLLHDRARGARRAVNSCRTASATGDRSCSNARESGTQRAFTRRTQFAANRIIVMQIERAQERLERQSLDRQRAEDDRERRQHDQVAIRKRRWQRHCRSQRDNAAHAGPRNDQAAADGRPQHRPWRMKTAPAVSPSDDCIEGHVPGEAHDDHGQEDRAGDDESIARGPLASRLSRIGRICRPMKMNARMFSTKTTVSHTA